MRHLRRITSDEKHVIHSLRHNMKDKLILAEVSSLDQNLILGHDIQALSVRKFLGLWVPQQIRQPVDKSAIPCRPHSRIKLIGAPDQA